MKRILLILCIILPTKAIYGQEVLQDSIPTKKNLFTVDASLKTRGEIRHGGLPPTSGDQDKSPKTAAFVSTRTTLSVGYEREWLSAKITAEHSGTWGDVSSSIFSVYEAWAQLRSRQGLFAKIGRQDLSYDDERIFGNDDWAMSGLSHDAIKLGYEGFGHKLHLIGSFNQNLKNINGGFYYKDGLQPYKNLQALWYHYDIPGTKLGASLLFTNMGVQGGKEGEPDEATYYQQLVGTHLNWAPKNALVEGSFYYQMGREQHGLPIRAWMASIKGTYTPIPSLDLYTGYDYLSGDPYFAIPPEGSLGVIRHEVARGFSSLYGSHHKFYGAMDFFYVTTYVNGFSPGLQNAFAGCKYRPVKGLSLEGSYHFYATSSQLIDIKPPLGHELQCKLSYTFLKCVSLSAGYSFMQGTETMERLKRSTENRRLHWGWLMLKITPRFFQGRW